MRGHLEEEVEEAHQLFLQVQVVVEVLARHLQVEAEEVELLVDLEEVGGLAVHLEGVGELEGQDVHREGVGEVEAQDVHQEEVGAVEVQDVHQEEVGMVEVQDVHLEEGAGEVVLLNGSLVVAAEEEE